MASAGEISFSIDSAYLNQDPNQILTNLFQISLSTDSTPSVDARSLTRSQQKSLDITSGQTNQQRLSVRVIQRQHCSLPLQVEIP